MYNDSDRTTRRYFFGVSTISQALIHRGNFRFQLGLRVRQHPHEYEPSLITVENAEKEVARIKSRVINVTYAAVASGMR
jgi:hypothetical protein